VTTANLLESSGRAGRVHISSATAKYLDGAYKLQDAEANLHDLRNPNMRLETFFIEQTEPSSGRGRRLRADGGGRAPGKPEEQARGPTEEAPTLAAGGPEEGRAAEGERREACEVAARLGPEWSGRPGAASAGPPPGCSADQLGARAGGLHATVGRSEGCELEESGEEEEEENAEDWAPEIPFMNLNVPSAEPLGAASSAQLLGANTEEADGSHLRREGPALNGTRSMSSLLRSSFKRAKPPTGERNQRGQQSESGELESADLLPKQASQAQSREERKFARLSSQQSGELCADQSSRGEQSAKSSFAALRQSCRRSFNIRSRINNKSPSAPHADSPDGRRLFRRLPLAGSARLQTGGGRRRSGNLAALEGETGTRRSPVGESSLVCVQLLEAKATGEGAAASERLEAEQQGGGVKVLVSSLGPDLQSALDYPARADDNPTRGADSIIVRCPINGDGSVHTSTTNIRSQGEHGSCAHGSPWSSYVLLFSRLFATKLRQRRAQNSAARARRRRRTTSGQLAANPSGRRRRNEPARGDRLAMGTGDAGRSSIESSSFGDSSIEVEISRRMMKEHNNWFSLTFKNKTLEESYCQIRCTTSKSNMVYISITWLLVALVCLLSLPDTLHTAKVLSLATLPLAVFAFVYLFDSILYNRYMKYKLKEATLLSSQQRPAYHTKRATSIHRHTAEPTKIGADGNESDAPAQNWTATSPARLDSSISSWSYGSTGNHKAAPLVLRVARFWSKLDRIPMIWNFFIFSFNLIMTIALLYVNSFTCKLEHETGTARASLIDCNSTTSWPPPTKLLCPDSRTSEPRSEQNFLCIHEENLMFGIILIMIEMGSFFRSSYLRKVVLLTSITLGFGLFLFRISAHSLVDASSNEQSITWSTFNVAYDNSICPLLTIRPAGEPTNLSFVLRYNLIPPYTLASISPCDANLIEKSYIILVVMFIGLVYVCRSTERVSRLDFLWKLQASKELKDMRNLRHCNTQLLENILPDHVAAHFLKDGRNSEELYAKSYPCVAVLFASIPNFSSFYTEDINNGMECIRVLNEIIFDFDQLLEEEEFVSLEKVKTISSTYLAACGLNPRDQSLSAAHHLSVCCNFAFAMREALREVNVHCFNNFVMRIGISHGPLVGGVIGAKKPVFDIWGDTVNEASRMDSTGSLDKIQVPKRCADILAGEGFEVQFRGVIQVKGKGEMETYFVVGKPKPESRANTRQATTELEAEPKTICDAQPMEAQPDEKVSREVGVKILEPNEAGVWERGQVTLHQRRFNRHSRNTQSLRYPTSSRFLREEPLSANLNRLAVSPLEGLQGLRCRSTSSGKDPRDGIETRYAFSPRRYGGPRGAATRMRSASPVQLEQEEGAFGGLAKASSNTEESSLTAVLFNMVQMRRNYEPLSKLTPDSSTSANNTASPTNLASHDLSREAVRFISESMNDPAYALAPTGLDSSRQNHASLMGRPKSVKVVRKSTRRNRASLFGRRSNYRRAGKQTSEAAAYGPREESINENE